ncbi:flagellar basal-body rod protein FlgB [Syntrophobotulus glycolicus DSM 8271]|uniref:Flagellar basal body rod protein FlgB n=1 Tax=Syntrophobotulus glycolicus (strain DSM 8271 / FlGlyR) TaxID=645991 RepID=F0SZX4_SYNGF|nr:flagellar basal body rod protein FlgB [Syntrophobotulus glycolicus]ADY54985.1 flagellar basal-body rod protein FlgB [Syntrophobotulus glycolicus DSM 8271]
MNNWLDTRVLNILEGGLDGLSLRNKVLADNIANVDTPNFKKSDVNFEAVLQEAIGEDQALPMKMSLPGHLPGVGASAGTVVLQDNSTTIRNDGNNVDVDLEMSKVAENTLHYNALAQALISQFTMLKQAMRE